MQTDSEGYDNPVINADVCVDCGACEKACPVLNPVTLNPIQEVYAAWALDDEIRQSSSSGGLFSVFANAVLNNGGFVVGASLMKDFTVKHIVVTEKEDLHLLRSSKYVQSAIDETLYSNIKERLKNGQQGVFCGTPCQVAGIKKFLAKEYPIFFTIDLVCHGVPSPLVFAETIQKIKNDLPNVISFSFRDLRRWGLCFNVHVDVNGIITNYRLHGKHTFYQDAYLKNLMHRECCYQCPYATDSRIGDITLADFWGIGKKIPFQRKINKGVSFVGVVTDKGKALFEQIESDFFFEKRTLEEALAGGNKNLFEPSPRPALRDSFYNDVYSLSIEKLVEKYTLELVRKKTFWRRGIRKMKNLLKK